MNPTLPTGWWGRLLALMLLGFVIATAYLAAAAPLIDFYGERENVAETDTALLRRLNAVAAELPTLRARLAALHGAMDSDSLTLAGASDALAAAGLQSRLEPLAAASGMTIGSTEILPAETEDDYRRIGLRLIVSGSYEALLELLAAIDSGRPPLVVDNLQIRTLMRQLGAEQSVGLDASLDVYGFRLAAGEASKP
jgi:general secretion pathway protein M